MKTNTYFCDNCQSFFKEPKRYRQTHKKGKIIKHKFCTVACKNNFYKKSVTSPCGLCGKLVTRLFGEFKSSKSGHIFCNRSCAVSFNNTLKRKSRRSKCEMQLFELLIREFSNIPMFPNDKNLLDGYEVDIAIPSLDLAIEWNGIVHYQPIYGDDKLSKIQNRDKEKLLAAQRKNIQLIVIPDLVSTDKYVREVFFNICKVIRSIS